ncbi:GntR family transcriptional regulator [Fodinicola acaciae]|uniref:GntR family transcriptional regulator n=1 Tax=Fodinicola acaciae TaxID=2681555 RepID=UPI001651EB05|nr:GntR family transcriptional regulator [Fodinicola acaciae]
MLLTLDLHDPRPLHEQVGSAIRRAIADGELAVGERLPPARELAAALGINANTVLRALRDLRDEGVLEFRRGRGVSVLRPPEGRSVLVEKARELLAEADRYGVDRPEVIALIEELS